MAVFRNGPNGSFSGKVGSVVGYQWRGINVMRSLPKKSTKPRSEKQLANEMRMKLAMAFLSPITGAIRAGYQGVTEGLPMTPFNMALSYHKKNAIGGEYPDLFFDYTKAKISAGPLPCAESPTAIWTDDGLLVSWDRSPLKDNLLDDHNTIILLHFVEKNNWDIRTSGITRGMGSYLFPVPEALIGTDLHVYLTFKAPLSITMSDSRHIHVPSAT